MRCHIPIYFLLPNFKNVINSIPLNNLDTVGGSIILVPMPEYPIQAKLISWVLMSLLIVSPVHQNNDNATYTGMVRWVWFCHRLRWSAVGCGRGATFVCLKITFASFLLGWIPVIQREIKDQQKSLMYEISFGSHHQNLWKFELWSQDEFW